MSFFFESMLKLLKYLHNKSSFQDKTNVRYAGNAHKSRVVWKALVDKNKSLYVSSISDSWLNLSRAVTAKGGLIKSAARLITKPRRVYGRASRVPRCLAAAAPTTRG